MRLLGAVLFLTGMVLGFQNCSSSDQDPGLFVRESDNSAYGYGANYGEDCIADLCLPPEENIWIKIKENNPYTVNLFYNTSGYFNVGGTCGTSTFDRHTIYWELQLASGAQTIEGQGYIDQGCDVGKFNIPITGLFTDGKRYELTVEILGIDENGATIENPLPSSVSRVDVVIVNEDNSGNPVGGGNNNNLEATYASINANIFAARCNGCHGGAGGLTLSNYNGAIQGIVNGNPNASPIYIRVNDDANPMPPPGNARLNQNEINIIQQWIQLGAPLN